MLAAASGEAVATLGPEVVAPAAEEMHALRAENTRLREENVRLRVRAEVAEVHAP